MKVCVVGGTGNISRSIVHRLLEIDHEATCFNRGLSGSIADGARVIHGDRYNRELFEQKMQKEKFDWAIDMISFTRDDALSSIRAFQGVEHFIHCSSVATYGREFDYFPVTEDHPLRPSVDYGCHKAEADETYLEAYHNKGFPVTIIKPSITYGPVMGLIRQIGNDLSWLDRIRKGKPIIVSGDGIAIHQFMHVADAAQGFVHTLGKNHCIGQIYNMVKRSFTSWDEYHRTAMNVLGCEVEMVGVPAKDIFALSSSGLGTISDIFSHNSYFSGEKLFKDVPEFQPKISLKEGMTQVLEVLDREGRIPNSDESNCEDRIIEFQRQIHLIK